MEIVIGKDDEAGSSATAMLLGQDSYFYVGCQLFNKERCRGG
ncbi:MAG: hypothetical protein NVSMB42_07680 [Herpetosiphon sp.]